VVPPLITPLLQKDEPDPSTAQSENNQRLKSRFCGVRPKTVARAAPTTAMTHIAIQEKLGGKVVEWMEQVSDTQYRP
jgi:hypothetical protein